MGQKLIDLNLLQKIIGYRFKNISLLNQALTHRSAGKHHNERLEFLGDAVLSFDIADYLYRQYPHSSEGQLTRARAELVKRETLAKVGKRIGLNHYLIMGSGELRSGGPNRSSTLADTMEALIASVYLDGGLKQARALIQRLLAPELEHISPDTSNKDPKTRLQEYLQARGLALPKYRVVQIYGQPHQQVFITECSVSDLNLTASGQGSNRRKSEQQAAQHLLEKIQS